MHIPISSPTKENIPAQLSDRSSDENKYIPSEDFYSSIPQMKINERTYDMDYIEKL